MTTKMITALVLGILGGLLLALSAFFYYSDRTDKGKKDKIDILSGHQDILENQNKSNDQVLESILSTKQDLLEKDDEIINKIDASNKKISDLENKLDRFIKESNINFKSLEKYIKNLPFQKGPSEIDKQIDILFTENKISSKEKEYLKTAGALAYELNENYANEIKRLKAEGKNDLAEVLKSIQKYFQEREAKKIKEYYSKIKENQEKENAIILKESIKATEALLAYDETVWLYEELIKIEPTVFNFRSYADYLRKHNFLKEAIKYYEKAIKKNRVLINKGTKEYTPLLAQNLNDIGNLYEITGQVKKSLSAHNESLEIFKKLNKIEPNHTYQENIALSLNNMGLLNRKLDRLDDSEENYKQSLNMYKSLPKTNYLHDFNISRVLHNLALSQKDKGEFENSELNFLNAIKIIDNLSEEYPEKFLEYKALYETNIGILYKNNQHRLKAKISFDKSLNIYRKIVNTNPRVHKPDLANTLYGLAELHFYRKQFQINEEWQKDNEDAFKYFEEALKIRKEIASQNPSVYELTYAKTLIFGVKFCFKNKEMLDEAETIIRKKPSNEYTNNLLKEIKKLREE